MQTKRLASSCWQHGLESDAHTWCSKATAAGSEQWGTGQAPPPAPVIAEDTRDLSLRCWMAKTGGVCALRRCQKVLTTHTFIAIIHISQKIVNWGGKHLRKVLDFSVIQNYPTAAPSTPLSSLIITTLPEKSGQSPSQSTKQRPAEVNMILSPSWRLPESQTGESRDNPSINHHHFLILKGVKACS